MPENHTSPSRTVIAAEAETNTATAASLWQILLIFLRLGCTSFGGPVAHLAFFQTEFVEKRRWLSASAYADLVALCQFLPGPASSQVGMALGWQQAGWRGALLAFAGFTLPSALLLMAAAIGLLHGAVLNAGAQLGLLLVTMAVVAQALWSMQRSLCRGLRERGLALVVAGCLLLTGGGLLWQLLLMLGVALLGGYLLGVRRSTLTESVAPANLKARCVEAATSVNRQALSRDNKALRLAIFCLGLLGGLLLLTPWLAQQSPESLLLQLTDRLLRAGSLVFGGGHVVLPWLHSEFVGSGLVSEQLLASGYGMTQAMPGPLFSVSALLGTASSLAAGASPWQAFGYGIWALLVMFLPAWLLVLAAMPYWQQLRAQPRLQAMLQAVNAAVVGLLLVAWLQLWPSLLASPLLANGSVTLLGSVASLGAAVFALVSLTWLLQQRWLPVWGLVALAAAVGQWLGS
ncbi:MAG TPA: chromate transporter [Rheinheimera sp.]|nr:chromate transporter [Rheinheimera sp.]